MMCANTSAYSMASKESSIQPRAAAIRVRRCALVIWERVRVRLVAIGKILNC